MSEQVEERHVLIVGERSESPTNLRERLETDIDGFEPITVDTVEAARTALADQSVACTLLCVPSIAAEPENVLTTIRQSDPAVPVLAYTKAGSDVAVEPLRTAELADVFRACPEEDPSSLLASRIETLIELGEARSALEERRERLQTYAAMVHSMLESACIYDEEARFELVNEHLATWYGKSREAIEGQKSNLIPKINDQYDGEPFEELLAGEREQLSGRIEGEFPGHGEAVLEYTLSPLQVNGSVEGVLGVTRDISQRAARQAQLERAFEEYQELFNGMNDTAWVMDLEGNILAVNDVAVEQLGYSRAEFKSMQPWDIDTRLDPETIEQMAARMAEDEVQVFETEHQANDGTTIPVEISSSLVTYRDEPAILSIGRDISSRREREKRLDQFASIVSHDLRNPLNVAEGRLELAQETGESAHLEAVERAHERMQTLIEDILALAREGKAVTEPEPMALGPVVTEAWACIEETEATLQNEVSGQVVAERSRLIRLFENLFRNAVEHAGPTVTVTVGDLEDGFFVADDGPGIPPSEQSAVFQAGYSTAEEGTGFGLQIVEQIVDAHDWDLALSTSESGGAQFEVTGVT